MGLVVEKKRGIETVGALIAALQTFPQDMPIEAGLESTVSVYRVKPERGEVVDDKRGRVCIDCDDEA